MLHVPRRSSNIPLFLRKDAKRYRNGKKAYSAKSIYFRDGAKSTPAVEPNQLEFLFDTRKRSVSKPTDVSFSTILMNNLRGKDPSLIEFVGRNSYLSQLWFWLLDRYVPVRIVTGIGGVGKTTLVRHFAEAVLDRAPLGFEQVVWLTAKRVHFRALKGTTENAASFEAPHFHDTRSFLISLLSAIVYAEGQFDNETEHDELLALLAATLAESPAFIVVDDIDTLNTDDQAEVFHVLNSVMHQTIPNSPTPSKAIITSRLKLGAAPTQLLTVNGFTEAEFQKYSSRLCDAFEVNVNLKRGTPRFKKFYSASQGSPLFAASIVRLASRGNASFDQCLEQWKGSLGEDVRRFAFDRELSELPDSQVRTVYALCLLRKASFIELQNVTESGQQLLEEDLDKLRDYHLISSPSEALHGGLDFVIEPTLAPLRELVASKIADPRRIESRCEALRRGAGESTRDVGLIISRIVALWDAGRAKEALEVAENSTKGDGAKHPDLHCILGRAYLRTSPPLPGNADSALKLAFSLGCERHELFDLWVEARRMRGDWNGVIEICSEALKSSDHPKYICETSQAHINLGEAADVAQNWISSIGHYLTAGRKADAYLAESDAHMYFEELKTVRRTAYLEALRVARKEYREADRSLEVWRVVFEAFNSYVRFPAMLRVGAENLLSWAHYVVNFRDAFHENTLGKLRASLAELGEVRTKMRGQDWMDPAVEEFLEEANKKMQSFIEAYLSDTN